MNDEKAVLKALEENYKDALAEINSKIELLMSRQDADMQHVIYQAEYQKALKTQIQAILETLQANEFETLSEYLAKSYEEGFLGTMYDLQGQGIPLVFPLDQAQIVDAIQTESKLSTRTDTKTGKLYASLGDDIKDLQKKIAGEISRGLSTGMMYSEMARNIASWARIPKNNAMRIARTEAHRIQCKAAYDAQHKAKSKGADVVKQWDSTLDGKTRDSHRAIDGEIKELDEKFSNGLEYPGDPSGRPEEVINCRCALLQRARWALGNDYTKWSEDAPVVIDDDGTTQFVRMDAKNYDDFKEKYNQATERVREGAQKMKAVNKYGDEIVFDFERAKNQERAEKAKQLLTRMANEYNTSLHTVALDGSGRAAGHVTMDGYMGLGNFLPDTVLHEFAHSLAGSNRVKYEFADENEVQFMKEITKLFTKYKKDYSLNPSLSISAYSRNDKEEFMAEAFAQAKMIELGIELPFSYHEDTTYSKMVMELIDKYFKK